MTNGPWKKRMWEDTPIFSQGKAIGALFFPADVCVDFSITTRQQQPEQEKHSRLGLKVASYYLPHTDSLSGIYGSRIGEHWAMQPALWAPRLWGKEEGWEFFLTLQEIQREEAKHQWCCKKGWVGTRWAQHDQYAEMLTRAWLFRHIRIFHAGHKFTRSSWQARFQWLAMSIKAWDSTS